MFNELPSRTKDITGKKFGKLTIIQFVGSIPRDLHGVRSKAAKWSCICDCGSKVEAFGVDLRIGYVRSCGCLLKEIDHHWHRKPFGQSAAHDVFCFYRNHGRKHKGFNLKEEEFLSLIIQPCHYCGNSLTNERKNRRSNGSFKYTGLDRVDSNRGYESDNVVPCCSICNFMKRHLPKEQFLTHIENIYYFQKSKEEL